MNLLMLGTGSADGWPNPFCSCASCTSERAASRLRGQTSVLVDDRLLLDCGPETPRAAERLGADLTGLRHVLVTHAHPDHCAPAFLLFRSWIGDAPLDVVGPADVIDQARMWVAPDSTVRFVTVSAGDRLALGDYDVRVLEARHDGDAVLYDVSTTDARLLYATDTGPLPQATLDAVAGAAFDVVLMEETFGDHLTHGTDHLDLATFPEQVHRLRAAGAVTEHTDLVAVHLSHHNPPTPELDRRLSAWGARTVADGTMLGQDHAVTGGAGTVIAGTRTLVIGGARSGKSREAERLLAAEPEVTYVATSYPAGDPSGDPSDDASGGPSGDDPGDDPEWTERVRRHQARRPAHWATVETLDLVGLLTVGGGPLLVDCLTLWLTRVMDTHEAWDDDIWRSRGDKAVADEVDALVAAWRGTRRRVVAVTNEVGQGVVPDTASGRRFRDLMGRLNARLAAETEDVRWCVAGRVTRL
jgi:adenosylcobinamide kinase / adenosylcobinamide-phosphate guanylyltransferase